MAADQNGTGRDRVRVLSRAVTVTGTACWTLLAVAGCGADGPSNTVAPHDTQIGYFPTAVGIQWVYDQPVPDFGVVTLTQEISAAEPVSGGTRVTLLQQSSAPDGSRSTSEFVFEQTDDGAVRVPFQLTTADGEEAIDPAAPAVFWSSPQDHAAGTVRTGTFEVAADSPEGETGSATYTSTPMGSESVTVPAGEFEADRISIVVEIAYPGTHPSRRLRQSVDNWMVEGMGYVKQQVSSDDGFSLVSELRSFTAP